MSKAESQTFSLLTEYKVKAENRNYLFKNPTGGGSYGSYHLSRKGKTFSLCGNADLSDQPNRRKRKKKLVHQDVDIQGIKFLSGMGNVCNKCLSMWKNNK